jgi:cytochrome c
MSSSLEINKVVAAVLAAGVIAGGASFIGAILISPDELEEHAYPVAEAEEPAESTAGEAPAPEESVLALLADADIAAGEKSAKACAACHSFDKDGPNKVGPNLWDIVDAAPGGKAGFKYSEALTSLSGTPWTYENLDAFLKKPKDYAPGTKMSFAGIKKVDARADMIAWMRTLSDDPAALPSAEPAAAAEPEEAAASQSEEAADAGETMMEEASEAVEEAADEVSEAVGDAAEAANEAIGEAVTAVAAAAGVAGMSEQIAAADPEAGAKVSRKCKACHSFDQGGKNKVGPALWNVVGQKVAAGEGYMYSEAAIAKGEAGATWDYANLDAFLEKPKEWLPGTKMSFAGIRKAEDRAAMIAYMRLQADTPLPLE